MAAVRPSACIFSKRLSFTLAVPSFPMKNHSLLSNLKVFQKFKAHSHSKSTTFVIHESTNLQEQSPEIIANAEVEAHGTSDKLKNDKILAGSRDVKFKNLNKSLKPPQRARDYFRQSWMNHYASIAGENRKESLEDGCDEFGMLNLSDDGQVGNAKEIIRDERDPNERLQEIIPDEVDESRDRRLNIPLTRGGRIGKNAYYYTRKMSILERQGKVKEAIAVFDHWMMLRDRVMPNKRTFVVLIGILGRVGYTEKAFEAYRQMRNLGLDAEDRIYTSLFNACANSPWPREYLKTAENFLQALNHRGVQLNLISVKAAAKAMAICGNFPQAFAVMDNAAQRFQLDNECFNHLLMACVADKHAGFSRALQVWQKMQMYSVRPHISTYNLLIRAVRDCGIGDPHQFATVLGIRSADCISPKDVRPLNQGVFQDTNSTETLLQVKTQDSVNSGSGNEDGDRTARGKSGSREKPPDETKHGVMKEYHNLYHDGPGFDKVVDEFIIQRNAHRVEDGSAELSEWWEERPGLGGVREGEGLNLAQHADFSLPDLSASDNSDTKGAWLSKDFPEMSWSTQHELDTRLSDLHIETTSPPYLNMGLTNLNDKRVTRDAGLSKTSGEIETDNHSSIPDVGLTIQVKDIRLPSQRLAILGGARKFVQHMVETGASPDVRTFSQLVKCLPDTQQAEEDLLVLMEEVKVTPDVDLINDLMMKRAFRHSGHTIKNLLPILSRLGLVPNMRTYAALALTCYREREAWSLLEDMKAANLEPTSHVMGHFIYISRANFTYKLHMLQHMEMLSLWPVPKTIQAIEKSIAITRKKIIAAEKAKDLNSPYLSQSFQRSFQRFLIHYRDWLTRTSMHQTPHPWKGFQQEPRAKHVQKIEDDSEDEEAT